MLHRSSVCASAKYECPGEFYSDEHVLVLVHHCCVHRSHFQFSVETKRKLRRCVHVFVLLLQICRSLIQPVVFLSNRVKRWTSRRLVDTINVIRIPLHTHIHTQCTITIFR